MGAQFTNPLLDELIARYGGGQVSPTAQQDAWDRFYSLIGAQKPSGYPPEGQDLSQTSMTDYAAAKAAGRVIPSQAYTSVGGSFVPMPKMAGSSPSPVMQSNPMAFAPGVPMPPPLRAIDAATRVQGQDVSWDGPTLPSVPKGPYMPQTGLYEPVTGQARSAARGIGLGGYEGWNGNDGLTMMAGTDTLAGSNPMPAGYRPTSLPPKPPTDPLLEPFAYAPPPQTPQMPAWPPFGGGMPPSLAAAAGVAGGARGAWNAAIPRPPAVPKKQGGIGSNYGMPPGATVSIGIGAPIIPQWQQRQVVGQNGTGVGLLKGGNNPYFDSLFPGTDRAVYQANRAVNGGPLTQQSINAGLAGGAMYFRPQQQGSLATSGYSGQGATAGGTPTGLPSLPGQDGGWDANRLRDLVR